MTTSARGGLALLTLLSTLAGAQAAPSAAVAAGVPELVPHRAAYELSRGTNSVDPEVIGVRGRMEVTFEASCDGWRLEQSLGLRLYTEMGVAADSLAVLQAFETSDAQRYYFNTHGYENGRRVETIRGTAHADPDSGAVRLILGEPVKERRELPEGTLFPVLHLRQMLEAARDGERSVVRVVFDGSTMESPYEVSAVFGAEREAHPRVGDAGGRAWPVRLAYFRPDAVLPDPEFEMSMLLHENGIAGDMVYDYGELEIDVTLRDVELLEPVAGCR